MLAMLLDRLFFAFALILLAFVAIEQFDPDPPTVLIDAGFVPADYQRCSTVRTAPLLRSPKGSFDYRSGKPFNDKGIS